MWLQNYLYDNLPGKGLDKARWNRAAAHQVANELLDSKSEALLLGKDNRDVMSILGMLGLTVICTLIAAEHVPICSP